MQFVKVHGAGNDFVLLPDLDDALHVDAALTRRLCTPHTGLGADGVIRLAPARTSDCDVFMDYRNADGSVAEMCGNGVRCVAKYVWDRGLVTAEQVRVDTRGGAKVVEVAARHPDGRIAAATVDMGVARLGEVERDVPTVGVRLTSVDMGNPHAVYHTTDIAGTPLARIAGQLNALADFPAGVNVEAIQVDGRSRLRGRVHERGVGETLASGTGVSAMAVAAVAAGSVDSPVTVTVPGGELDVAVTGGRVFVTGPAVEVAHGTLDDAWLTA